MSSFLSATCGQKDLIIKDVDVSATCEVQWYGGDRGVLAGDGLKQSHTQVWDAQPTTLLESFAARAGSLTKRAQHALTHGTPRRLTKFPLHTNGLISSHVWH